MNQPNVATPELEPDDIVELEIGEVAHGGVFVARHDSGRVVFVADTLPGERVRARVTEVKKKFARAETVEVLDASKHRHPHIWREADVDRDPDDRPGGAEFGHMLPSFSRELKRRVLAEQLSRFGGVEVPIRVQALDGDDASRGTGWRTRVTLHVDESGRVGPFASRSHRVVDVSRLPLAFDGIEEFAMDVIAKGHKGPGRLDFVAPADHDVLMRPRVTGMRTKAPKQIIERVGNREFVVAEDGFWQVHRLAAQTLYDAVQRGIRRDHFDAKALHFDLFGGVGLLGAAVAELGGSRIQTVEAVTTATSLAAQNLVEWPTAEAKTGRVDRFLQQFNDTASAEERAAARAGTVVLDPPRSGAKAAVIDPLADMQPAQIIYVACDPAALGRDTGLLRERGYQLVDLQAFDLFPNTHHVEAVATFLPA